MTEVPRKTDFVALKAINVHYEEIKWCVERFNGVIFQEDLVDGRLKRFYE
jgi:hypothetical protein